MAGCAPSVTSIARILPVIVRPELELKFKYFIRLWKFFWAPSRVCVEEESEPEKPVRT